MTQQRMIEKFEGIPVTQLGWRDLLRYNIALTFTEVQSGPLSGNIDGGIAARHGITWEYEQQPATQTGTTTNSDW